MKKSFFILLIICFSSIYSQNIGCKEDLFPLRSKDKKMYGYVDIFGNWKIIPFYDLAGKFNEGVAVVNRKSKYGLIDCAGKVLLTCDYDTIQDFENGYSWVQKNKLWGMVDRNGKFILECKYQEVQNISKFYDLAWLKTNEKWGVYDKEKLKFIHEAVYDDFFQLSHDFSLVSQNGKRGMIQHQKVEKILDTKYDSIQKFAPYLMAFYENGKIGVIRDNGRLITNPIYSNVKNIGNTFFAAKKDSNYAVFDVWGKRMVPFVLDSVGFFRENLCVIKYQGAFSYLNTTGQNVIGKFIWCDEFKNGKAFVRDSLGYYLVNKKAEKVSEVFQAVDLYPAYFAGFKNGFWDVYSLKNANQSKNQFVKVIGGEPNQIKLQTQDGFRFYDLEKNDFATPLTFQSIGVFKNEKAIAKSDGKWGLLANDFKQLIPFQYDEMAKVEIFDKSYYLAKQGNINVVFDERGMKIAENEGECLPTFANKIIFSKNGKYGLMDAKSVVIVKPMYQKISTESVENQQFAKSLIVKNKNKYGLTDLNGKVILSPKYTGYTYLGKGIYEFKSKKSTIKVDYAGNMVE
jgi:hypothetical protein